MFSGGRDSTLAAVKLADLGFEIILVTVTSPHLVGVWQVIQRLHELAKVLPLDTVWMPVSQESLPKIDSVLHHQTCLPCQRDYARIGVSVARTLRISNLALGYTNYQNDWPEQTDLAISVLDRVLALEQIQLHLPVRHLSSKVEAMDALLASGLSEKALEQKCMKQVTNIRLDEHALRIQVALWERSLKESFSLDAAISLTRTFELGGLPSVDESSIRG
jgi:hypothetical protein